MCSKLKSIIISVLCCVSAFGQRVALPSNYGTRMSLPYGPDYGWVPYNVVWDNQASNGPVNGGSASFVNIDVYDNSGDYLYSMQPAAGVSAVGRVWLPSDGGRLLLGNMYQSLGNGDSEWLDSLDDNPTNINIITIVDIQNQYGNGPYWSYTGMVDDFVPPQPVKMPKDIHHKHWGDFCEIWSQGFFSGVLFFLPVMGIRLVKVGLRGTYDNP